MDKEILVVDDSPSVRVALQVALEDNGYVVESADSAETALQLLETGWRPALIISDYNMPGGMNGLEFWGQLKKSMVEAPFILMTADLTWELQEKTDASGITVLVKPISQNDLRRIVGLFLSA